MRKDSLGALLSRLSNRFRMTYRVEPGLYSMGNPTAQSPVMVTANYKLTFDHLRRGVGRRDAWILVLDTQGINVWCAAGKGTFGTEELVRQLRSTRLESRLDHRELILPQLGAPGIDAQDVKNQTGFTVTWGPVRSQDIPTFLDAKCTATPQMRAVTFNLGERIVLIPMECGALVKRSALPLLLLAALLGLQKEGILFRAISERMPPLLAAWAMAIFGGAVLHPVLLPSMPVRAFALQGFLIGVLLSLVFVNSTMAAGTPLLNAMCVLLILGLTSYAAFNFTGCSPIANKSGVKRELRWAFPFYLASLVSSIVLLVLTVIGGFL